jgi:hypothetical protein
MLLPNPQKRTRRAASSPKKRRKVARGTELPPVKLKSQEPPTFESQLRESQPEEAISAPNTVSEVATVATAEESDTSGFEEDIIDNFDGIKWGRLPKYIKLLTTQKQRKS